MYATKEVYRQYLSSIYFHRISFQSYLELLRRSQ
jgi:hypothetical protein